MLGGLLIHPAPASAAHTGPPVADAGGRWVQNTSGGWNYFRPDIVDANDNPKVLKSLSNDEFTKYKKLYRLTHQELGHTGEVLNGTAQEIEDAKKAAERVRKSTPKAKRGFWKAGVRIGQRIPWKGLGTVTLAATAAQAGWDIGTALRKNWTGEDLPSQPTGDGAVSLVARDKGELIASVGAGGKPTNDGDGEVHVKSPDIGWTFQANNPQESAVSLSGGAWVVVGGKCLSQYGGALNDTHGLAGGKVPTVLTYSRDWKALWSTDYVIGCPFPYSGVTGMERTYYVQHFTKAKPDYHKKATTSPKTPNPAYKNPQAETLTDEQIHTALTDGSMGRDEEAAQDVLLGEAETVPDCTGLTWLGCVELLDDAGLTGLHNELAQPAPHVGPNEVSHTVPKAGSQIDGEPSADVGSRPSVQVYVNPQTAPPSGSPAGGGSTQVPGGWAPPAVPAIDLSPLNVGAACDVFPFGIPCYVIDSLANFEAASSAPVLTMPLPLDQEIVADLSVVEPTLLVVRPILLLGACLGLALWLAGAAGIGGRGERSATDDD